MLKPDLCCDDVKDKTAKTSRQDIRKQLDIFPELFSEVPPGTSVIHHDIDVGSALPIKQHAYRFLCLYFKVLQFNMVA
ncbi:hypothetical protein QTP70_004464 [Hemibagrus guttatus]|uniref:Uncharacterized protein n=1 Tax=Hemibagrus guttatus TaxID=175788 RepID=A0AAE0V8I9_9TELE|nr:hypothetical protein QTP70_004464 [Hemibagrus guttatus]